MSSSFTGSQFISQHPSSSTGHGPGHETYARQHTANYDRYSQSQGHDRQTIETQPTQIQSQPQSHGHSLHYVPHNAGSVIASKWETIQNGPQNSRDYSRSPSSTPSRGQGKEPDRSHSVQAHSNGSGIRRSNGSRAGSIESDDEMPTTGLPANTRLPPPLLDFAIISHSRFLTSSDSILSGQSSSCSPNTPYSSLVLISRVFPILTVSQQVWLLRSPSIVLNPTSLPLTPSRTTTLNAKFDYLGESLRYTAPTTRQNTAQDVLTGIEAIVYSRKVFRTRASLACGPVVFLTRKTHHTSLISMVCSNSISFPTEA